MKTPATTQTRTNTPQTNPATAGEQPEHPGKQALESRPAYLSVRRAATLTGMSPYYWRRQALDGQVDSVKLGKRLLIPRTEIERIVVENTRPRVQPATAITCAEER